MGKKDNIIYGSPTIVTLPDAMRKFRRDQLSVWLLARRNVRSLKHLQTKIVNLDGLDVQVQYNPSRAISSKAALDPESVAARPCFLCRANRPAEQRCMEFEGAKNKKYDILVNPYPILPYHFIAASREHVPQSICHRYVDMLRLSKRARGFTFLYNGPLSGASAPDHFHFQAVPSSMLPLEIQARSEGTRLRLLASVRDAAIYLMDTFVEGVFVIRSRSSKSASKLFYRLLDCALIGDDSVEEPKINVFTAMDSDCYLSIVVMRSRHRPDCYFSDDPQTHFSVSPGCVDMGGVFITVDREDFERLDAAALSALLRDVTLPHGSVEAICRRLTRGQKQLNAHILRAEHIDFEILSYGAGVRTASLCDGRVEYGGMLYDEVVFDGKVSSTMFSEASFTVRGLNGGASGGSYAGALRIVADGDALVASNVIGIEDYLLSALCRGDICGEAAQSETLEERVIALRTRLLEAPDGTLGAVSCAGHADVELKRAVDATWGVVNPAKNV